MVVRHRLRIKVRTSRPPGPVRRRSGCRRLLLLLLLWTWRKRRQRCPPLMFRSRRRHGSGSGCRMQSQPSPEQSLRCAARKRRLEDTASGGSDGPRREPSSSSRSLQTAPAGPGKTGNVENAARPAGKPSQNFKAEEKAIEGCKGSDTQAEGKMKKQQRPTSRKPEQRAKADGKKQEESTSSCQRVGLNTLSRTIRDFLESFYKKYGSFIPLSQSDVQGHLRRTFNCDFSERKAQIMSEVTRIQITLSWKSAPTFPLVYKKHSLSLEDLSTLEDQNWLNDQVMNMYGELIMESSHHRVHFLNSFFHRQLMTKGYEGVKRWTKQVDLFSKRLLLVPVHLEVHWSLVSADLTSKRIRLYDSQGIALHKVAKNIQKYLTREANEKQQGAFRDGWTLTVERKIPRQTNENDCGVFVLEYSRCLALSRPFRFSQRDIPRIRKRIYKELCDRRLQEAS